MAAIDDCRMTFRRACDNVTTLQLSVAAHERTLVSDVSSDVLNIGVLGEPMPGQGPDAGLELLPTADSGAPQSKPSSGFRLAVVVSILLHGAIAWAGINNMGETVLGGADIEIETISVEIVGAIPRTATSGQTGEAVSKPAKTTKAERPPKVAVAPEQSDAEIAALIDEQPAPKPLRDEKRKVEESAVLEDFPKELQRKPAPKTPAPDPDMSARLPEQTKRDTVPPEPAPIVEDFPPGLPMTRTRPEAKERADKKIKIEQQATKPKKQPPKKKVTPARDISQGSRASSSSTQATASTQQRVISASQGALRLFARKIARALAKSRPRRIRATGTVMVAFTLSLDGALKSVRVRTSSGNSRIDRAATRAVRRAKFPRPPRGATLGQRSFVIPYHFRKR